MTTSPRHQTTPRIVIRNPALETWLEHWATGAGRGLSVPAREWLQFSQAVYEQYSRTLGLTAEEFIFLARLLKNRSIEPCGLCRIPDEVADALRANTVLTKLHPVDGPALVARLRGYGDFQMLVLAWQVRAYWARAVREYWPSERGGGVNG